MAFSINRVEILGNVAREPEMRYTPNGNAVCSFSVATNHSIKQGNEYKDIPTFHNVVVWGKKAEWVAQNIHKGDKLYVEGRLDNRSWQDQQGNKKYKTEIVANEVISMAGNRQRATHNDEAEPAPTENINLDDLPDFGQDLDSVLGDGNNNGNNDLPF